MKKIFVTLFSAGLLFFLSLGYVNAQTVSDWPMFMHDRLHTGSSPLEVMGAPLNLDWVYQTEGMVFPSVVVSQSVFFRSTSNLYALDSLGNLEWSTSMGLGAGTGISGPAVDNGVLFIGGVCSGCSLQAFDISNGNLKWSSSPFPSGVREPVVANGVVYVGSDDGNLRAFDEVSGNLLWITHVSGGIVTTPAVDNGKVFVASFAGPLYSFDASTGAILWSTQNTGATTGINSSPTVANGVIYVGSGDAFVYAVDENTGIRIWRSSHLTDSVWSTPALADGVLYIQDLAGKVFALDANTGSTKWTYQTGAAPSSSYGSAAVSNGVVYIGSSDGYLYVFDATTGGLIERHQTGGAVLSSPSVSNGKVYIGSNDGKMYSFSMSAVNHKPVINSIPNQVINEGDVYSTNGLFSDSDSTSWIGTVDYGDGSGVQPLVFSGMSFSLNHTYVDNGSYTLTVNIVDNQGAVGMTTSTITVNNLAPTVGVISSPGSVGLNDSFSASVNFADMGVLDTHTAMWNWGDGNVTVGTLTESNGSGSVINSHTYTTPGSYVITLTVTDNGGSSGQNSTNVNVVRRLTSLAPAQVWVGLKNSDDVGIKFDLLAEVYKDNTLVTSGELDSVDAGTSGFSNAKLDTISFNSFSAVDFPTGSELSLKLYVRNACNGSGHNSGTARLWYNDSAANSRFGSTISNISYVDYLLNNFLLGTSVGAGPRVTIDIAAGAKCSSFKSFGTWTITP